MIWMLLAKKTQTKTSKVRRITILYRLLLCFSTFCIVSLWLDVLGSGMEDEDDEEEIMMDEDSNWSDGGDESDDSIAVARARKKKKHRGPLGRQEQYHEGETVRRSTRRRKSRVTCTYS